MKKLLVIDDEEPLRDVVRSALSLEGYDVIDAGDGTTGLALARSHQPALILCDVHMQGLDGYAILEALRKEPATAAIPVILMTGIMRDYSSVRHAMEIGADDYLLKPFSVDDLIAAVRTRLQKQQTIVQRAEVRLSELRTNIALSLPHELRTPLVAILGFSDLLKVYYETMDRKEIGSMAEDIHKAATRLHSLIENFLVYAQIELMGTDQSKINALRRERTSDIHELLRIAAHQNAQEFQRTADLTFDLHEGSAAISSDYFLKVVGALLDNAFKFSEKGTPVRTSSSTEGPWFIVTVDDRGRGMSPEQIADVGGYMQFERKMYEQQGSGLGLIIAKRLTDLHGGSMTIENKAEGGTVVTVKLPRG